MEKLAAAAVAAGEDLISGLPDEILHSIIRRIACSKAADQTADRTIALSSRWRNLWRSYPVVQLNPKARHKFYSIGSEDFQKFHDATMKKFNQDKLLRMEALKLSIKIDDDDLNSSDGDELLYSDEFNIRSSAVQDLLELASERKAEYVDIETGAKYSRSLCFPFGLLSNSSAKTLNLEGISLLASGNEDLIVSLNSLRSLHLKNVSFFSLHRNKVRFDCDQLLINLIASSPLLETLILEFISVTEKVLRVSSVTKVVRGSSLRDKVLQGSSLIGKLKTLRFLHLNRVVFEDEQLLTDLIVSTPLLETLKLESIWPMRKLVVSNAANLKKLEIYACCPVEIQIAAFALRDLHIRQRHQVPSTIGLIAPQLNVLQLCFHYRFSLREISRDDLNYLRFLCLDEFTFDDEQVFLNLIASNPLLETLQLRNIRNLKKLQLSNVPNLKTLVVAHCIDLEEIEIAAAYELHSLHLFGTENCKRMLHKIELIAPQLNVLKMKNYGIRMVDLKAIVCKLQCLKYLNLVGIAEFRRNKSWKLKFAGRKLEEFILWVSRGLKKTELDADAGPSVLNFLRSYQH